MGILITFEGPDGSGKTTQIQALYKDLKDKGHPVVFLREPGGTRIGDQIRTVLHDTRNTEMLPNTELLLYSASRAQLVGQAILPALQAGAIVLCDRYAESTLAYQGFGRELDLALLKVIIQFATGGLRPDLIIYLDIEAEEGLRRRQQGSRMGKDEWNRMDQQELHFYQRVRTGYLQMAQAEPQRWFTIDATLPVADIRRVIREKVESFLAQRKNVVDRCERSGEKGDQNGRGGSTHEAHH